MKLNLRTRIPQLKVMLHMAHHGPAAPYHTNFHGYDLALSLNEGIQMEIALGNYEPRETRWVMDHLKPGMTFVDVGANIGYYSLVAARRVGPLGRVIAFEPSPYCVDRLTKTLVDNDIFHVELWPMALGDAKGLVEISLERTELHSPSIVGSKAGFCCAAGCTTLDSIVEATGIRFIHLMKMDVEGYEPNVLRGAEETLRSGKIGAIFCELSEEWLGKNHFTPEELEAVIRSYGYSISKFTSYERHQNVFFERRK